VRPKQRSRKFGRISTNKAACIQVNSLLEGFLQTLAPLFCGQDGIRFLVKAGRRTQLLVSGIISLRRAGTDWRQVSGSGQHTDRRVTVESQEVKTGGVCGAGVVKPFAGRTDPSATGIARLYEIVFIGLREFVRSAVRYDQNWNAHRRQGRRAGPLESFRPLLSCCVGDCRGDSLLLGVSHLPIRSIVPDPVRLPRIRLGDNWAKSPSREACGSDLTACPRVPYPFRSPCRRTQ
jgi:hypothetical protein